MIQDILPDIYNPDYTNAVPSMDDIILCYKCDGILLKCENTTLSLPSVQDIVGYMGIDEYELKPLLYYMFSISDTKYFQLEMNEDDERRIEYYKTCEEVKSSMNLQKMSLLYLRIHDFRTLSPVVMVFAGATGYHIRNWRNTKKYCGCCGSKTEKSANERAFICPKCKNIEYPKISPAVIVAIKDNDRLLLAKSLTGAYKKYGLISGFVEVGESFEQAVHREVLEETGLRVKNVRFYKDQPWGISGAHMIGFYADVDGDNTIVRQESELSEASWFEREEIPKYDNRLSVGSEMIERFRLGQE